MNKPHYTIHDIAKDLGVAPSTVSRALNDHPRISAIKKKEILEYAQKIKYRHNGIAAALRNGKSGMIGVSIPAANRIFFGNILRGIEQIANQNGYTIIITQSYEDKDLERKNLQNLIKAGVDGILMSVSKSVDDFSVYEDIIKRGTPLFFFDRTVPTIDTGKTIVDDYYGGYIATKHLISQGYNHVALFAGSPNILLYSERLRGYKDALNQSGLRYDPDLVFHSNLQIEDGKNLMLDILHSRLHVDAIFASSDYAALGAMLICKDKGISIPDQMGICGFSNEPFTEFISPSLTTVDQKTIPMGQLAIQSLLDHLKSPGKEYVKTVLTPELIIRDSSIKIHK